MRNSAPGYADDAIPAWFARPQCAPAVAGTEDATHKAPEEQGEPPAEAKVPAPAPQVALKSEPEAPSSILPAIMRRGQERNADLEKKSIIQKSDGTSIEGPEI